VLPLAGDVNGFNNGPDAAQTADLAVMAAVFRIQ
jgi:hypothetical protein